VDLNPYEELGVERDADEPTIRKAYRKVVKKAHPDAGGTADALHKVSTALAVLTDPKKRKAFDDTGRIEEDRPDNDRAAALQVLEAQMGTIINSYIGSGFAPINDPRRIDVVARITRNLEGEIAQAEDGIVGGQNVVDFMSDMATRFRLKAPGTGTADDDPIVRGLDRQIKNAQQQMADMEGQIRVRRLAITILAGYSFRADAPPASTVPSRTQWDFVAPGSFAR